MMTSFPVAGTATTCSLCQLAHVVSCFHPGRLAAHKSVAMATFSQACSGVSISLLHELLRTPGHEAVHLVQVYCQSISTQLQKLYAYAQLPESGQALLQALYQQALLTGEQLLADVKAAWPELYQKGLATTPVIKPLEWNWDMRETGSLLMLLKDVDAYKGSAKHAMDVFCRMSEFARTTHPSADYMMMHYNKLSFPSTQQLNRFFEHGFNHTNLKLKQFYKS